ncbi:hypothetical protein D3C85_1378670 [compost metagenome]
MRTTRGRLLCISIVRRNLRETSAQWQADSGRRDIRAGASCRRRRQRCAWQRIRHARSLPRFVRREHAEPGRSLQAHSALLRRTLSLLNPPATRRSRARAALNFHRTGRAIYSPLIFWFIRNQKLYPLIDKIGDEKCRCGRNLNLHKP